MEDDSHAIAIGLGVGLGGFVELACISLALSKMRNEFVYFFYVRLLLAALFGSFAADSMLKWNIMLFCTRQIAIFYFTCCEEKSVKSTAVQIPLRGQRIHRTEPPYAVQTHTTRFSAD